jgi:hypothetical protein
MTGVQSNVAPVEPGSAPECQLGGPDTRPDADAQERISALATLLSGSPSVTGAAPECPTCGGDMSRFPYIVYCGMCGFFIEAPGRRPQDSMGPLHAREGVILDGAHAA